MDPPQNNFDFRLTGQNLSLGGVAAATSSYSRFPLFFASVDAKRDILSTSGLFSIRLQALIPKDLWGVGVECSKSGGRAESGAFETDRPVCIILS
jgi:hypothetical protein